MCGVWDIVDFVLFDDIGFKPGKTSRSFMDDGIFGFCLDGLLVVIDGDVVIDDGFKSIPRLSDNPGRLGYCYYHDHNHLKLDFHYRF